MDTDKLVFGIIGGITLVITIVIIATSFSTSSPTNLNAKDLIGNDPHRQGPENAKLTLVEFSDFECPYCAQSDPILKSLMAEYPNDLAMVYRHFPLPMHPGAVPAARASEAANNQGKFWEYHDELFANQPNFSQSELEQYAQKLGLNMDQFKADYAGNDVINKVQEDADFGRSMNISATPTFYALYDDKAEQVSLQQNGDLESKVKSILGEPTGSTSTTPPATPPTETGDQTSTDGPKVVAAQVVPGTPQNVPMDVTLDIINVERKGKVAPSEVTIEKVEKGEWPDAGLGCPKQGESYAQVITPGFKILADAKGEKFVYHTDQLAKKLVFCGTDATLY